LVLKQNFYLKKGRDLKFFKSEKHKVRMYSLEEIAGLLELANFKIIKVFDSMSFKQINEKTRQMFIVPKKLAYEVNSIARMCLS
jgi:hypothetical protein